MRVVLVSSLLVISPLFVVFCGGSKKPAESAESPSESSAPAEAPAPSESAAEAAPSASASPAAAPEDKPAPAPSGPNVTGAIDGKPFVPKAGLITKPAQKDGRILITLGEHSDCGSEAGQGEGVMTLVVPWEDGYKQDLGSLKRGGKKGGGEISFVRVGAGGKKEGSASFKPTGRLTVISAPSDQNSVGKMNIDLQSGDYMLSGDLDVQLCVAAKSAAAAKAPAAAPAKKKKK